MAMKLFYTVYVIFYFVLLTDGREFRFDYTHYPSIDGWLKLHRVPAVWHEAQLQCKLEGAILASPVTPHLLAAMKVLMADVGVFPCGVFTGIHAIFSKGVYFSIEGVPLSKIPVQWAPDEPDNYENSEDCLAMNVNGTMADVKCTDVMPYICYKKKTKSMVVTGCGTIDDGYNLDARTGNCYKLHLVPKNWYRSHMTCAAEGGHLAIINSDVEAQILKEIFDKNPADKIPGKFDKGVAQIGFNNWKEPGMWSTINGETLQEAGYAKWANDQPDSTSDGLVCGGIFRSGLLDDINCNIRYMFFCEKSPDSLLDDNISSLKIKLSNTTLVNTEKFSRVFSFVFD